MAAASAICIVGARGMLGRELVQAYRGRGGTGSAHAVVHELDVEEMEITDAGAVASVLKRLRPGLVLNAAAYTDVDGSEAHPDLAARVNADGAGNLAQACRDIGCRLVHVSTDYVFDGRGAAPYEPGDPVNPQGVYGRTKADGERRVREALGNHAIVRTSWLFGFHGRNFVKTILRLAAERPELRIVADQVGCPTYARDLARALVTLADTGRTGTYHFCNAGACTWYDFAGAIVRLGGLATPIVPITTAELGRPAPRPAYSVLSTATLTRDAGIVPRPWTEALAECVEELRQCGESKG